MHHAYEAKSHWMSEIMQLHITPPLQKKKTYVNNNDNYLKCNNKI